VLFVLIDFWFTKNVNGRRLIGLRWYFGEDDQGIERFMFETRINSEYMNAINSKLFWIVQIIYIIVPIVELSTSILIAPNLYRISYPNVLLTLSRSSSSCWPSPAVLATSSSSIRPAQLPATGNLNSGKSSAMSS
jgi:hypothetical protein